MARLIFEHGEQKEYLTKTKERLDINWPDMAILCNVTLRTLRDWRKEKYKINYIAARRLSKLASFPISKTAVIRSEFWNNADAGRKGARIANKLYGNPGTAEGRRRGGLKAAEYFRNNPELAKAKGFITRKKIRCPARSVELAELIGIMLGDGGLPGNHQFTISFNYETDYEYAVYLRKLIMNLFGISSYIHRRRNSRGADIVINSTNLVEFLLKEGLVTGNKVKNQVDVPDWIYEKIEYRVACLRGLMDTDGGVYLHKYRSYGKVYRYLKLCFGNSSKPLLDFVFDTLRKLDFKAYLNGEHVSVYAIEEVKKYFCRVGSSNQKHIDRFKNHFVW